MTTANTPLSPEQIDTLILAHGNHPKRSMKTVCLMEAVAWVAGEKHSDAPECASKVCAAFGRSLNDSISDTAIRTELLRPLIVRLVGSKATDATEMRRMFLAVDWAVRTAHPKLLEAAGMPDLATKLRELAPIVDKATAISARDLARTVRSEATSRYSAAWSRWDGLLKKWRETSPASAASAADAADAAPDPEKLEAIKKALDDVKQRFLSLRNAMWRGAAETLGRMLDIVDPT